MKRLVLAGALILGACAGHIAVLPFYVAAELEEKDCVRHLPPDAGNPTGGALKWACERDGRSAYWELLGSDCSDIAPPPPTGTWSCGLEDGGSVWIEDRADP